MNANVLNIAHQAGVKTDKNKDKLPVLRDELLIHQGPILPHGGPSWTLEDPARNLFFRLGAAEFAMLNAWHLGQVQEVLKAVNQHTTIRIAVQDVMTFVHFLKSQQLVNIEGQREREQLAEYAEKTRSTWYQQVLKHYLFIRIPLWRPDNFLSSTIATIERYVLNKRAVMLTMLAGMIALLMVMRQWDTFIHSFPYFFTFEGAIIAGLTLVLTKTVHEFGHAYMCKHFGGRVSTMGVALMVMFPVLYTDTSGAWRLPSQRARLLIGGAGMMAETMLAAWATLLWNFLPDGMLRSATFILATTAWILTIAVNLNPLMRFDGYFLLSDSLNVPNLQMRAFALARWRLREWLFHFESPPPERFDRVRYRALLIYSYAVWIYRFFLFLGIALLVYHFAFKLLGILLFMVEMGFFIIRPIAMECKEWLKRRSEWTWNKHTIVFLSLLIIGLIVLIMPWKDSVKGPALMHSSQEMQIYAPDTGGQLIQLPLKVGQAVKKDQLLLAFNDPVQSQASDTVKRRLALLQWQSSFHTLSKDTLEHTPVAFSELLAVEERDRVLTRQMAQLSPKAPFDGVVADMAAPLSNHEWVSPGEWIATIIKPGSHMVEAYVLENDINHIAVGNQAYFYPQDNTLPSFSMHVDYIAHVATNDLSHIPELASVYGGRIAAVKEGQKLKPEQAIYQVRFNIDHQQAVSQTAALQGNVIIEGGSRSLLVYYIQKLIAVFIRESNF